MKQWYALSAIGKDRPGIVADLAELIFEHGCNLEDSSMTILGGEFAVLLLFTGSDEDLERRLSSACKRLEWERRLTVFFRPLEGPPVPYGHGERREIHELSATGVDKAGIVARVCRVLADHDVTIREMKTASRPEPESGTPLYTMRVEMGVSAALPLGELESALDRIAEELKIDISLRPRPPESGF
ncbi:MAG: glycine cleavage system protein R [Candidatus Binatia bacterium]